MTPADHISTAVVWWGHFSRTSGALKPGVPALGAFCCALQIRVFQFVGEKRLWPFIGISPSYFLNINRSW